MFSRYRIQSIIIVFVLIATVAIGQNSADIRIRQAFGNDYTDKLETAHPERIAYLNYFLENSYYTIDAPDGKGYTLTSTIGKKTNHDGSNTPNISVANIGSFNVLLYEFSTDREKRTFYKIDNSDKVIVFYSGSELAKAFNESKSLGQ